MNTTDILKYGHRTVMAAVDGLRVTDWHERGVCGWWSVREIIAHLASYELVLVDVLNNPIGSDPTSYIKEFQRPDFNDVQVEQRKMRTVDEIVAEYTDAHHRTMRLIETIPEAIRRQSGTLAWYGMEYDLEDFIAYAFYGHKREHSAQIAVFRDRQHESEAA